MWGKPPSIKRNSPVPISEQIAAWLRTQIAADHYAPDEDPLPSEHTIMETFDVSRDTARRVYDKLRDEGLVYTVPHRGTFVRRRATRGGRNRVSRRGPSEGGLGNPNAGRRFAINGQLGERVQTACRRRQTSGFANWSLDPLHYIQASDRI